MKTQSINVKDACNRTKRKTQFSVDTENMVNKIQPVFMKKIKNHWKKIPRNGRDFLIVMKNPQAVAFP